MDLEIYCIILLLIVIAVLIFFYLKRNSTCSNSTCSNSKCSNSTCSNKISKSLSSSSNLTITYGDVVDNFTQSIKNLPSGTGTNSPDVKSFASVLDALKDPNNVIMPDQLLNMTPQQIASLSDIQIYITNYITSMYLERRICLSSGQLIAMSPNQIINLNPVQAIFGMTQINAMTKNPLTPSQQDAFSKLGLY